MIIKCIRFQVPIDFTDCLRNNRNNQGWYLHAKYYIFNQVLTCCFTFARKGANSFSISGSVMSIRNPTLTFRCCLLLPQELDVVSSCFAAWLKLFNLKNEIEFAVWCLIQTLKCNGNDVKTRNLRYNNERIRRNFFKLVSCTLYVGSIK